MKNALNELFSILEQSKKYTLEIKCAVIGYTNANWVLYEETLTEVDAILNDTKQDLYFDGEWRKVFSRTAILKENWNNDEWLSFVQDLNFNYDDGFGSQSLFGIVWFKDGSWLERHEYDGSEWWEYKKTPAIPTVLTERANG